MLNNLVLKEQEDEGLPGDSEFIGVPVIFTEGFKKTFGNHYQAIGGGAIELINEKYPLKNWQYLQVFLYEGIEFWCISDAIQDRKGEHEHITFLMPHEY